MEPGLKKKFILITVYGIAMGLLEAVIVVYLRNMFYPDGFNFPLTLIPMSVLNVELLRELCTLIMLLSVSWLAAKNKLHFFSFFLYSFAVWDIFYYVGLKWLLDWPSSFLTWDILFLIPVPWLGPVLSPLISSVTMIVLSVLFLVLGSRIKSFKVVFIEWFFIYLGAVLIFATYIWDYTGIIISNNLLGKITSLANSNVFAELSSNYIPTSYHWEIFIAGILFVYFSMFLILRRNRVISLK